MDEAVIYAKKYLEDLLSFFGLNTDVHATTDEDMIELSVPSTHLNGFFDRPARRYYAITAVHS